MAKELTSVLIDDSFYPCSQQLVVCFSVFYFFYLLDEYFIQLNIWILNPMVSAMTLSKVGAVSPDHLFSFMLETSMSSRNFEYLMNGNF